MGKKLKRGFYWRNETIWVRTDPITGKPESTRCHVAAAAYAWRAGRERLATDPNYAAARQATVEDWVKRTIAHKTARRAEGTVNMYEVKLGHVVRLFGAETSLDDIESTSVDDYMTTRKSEGIKDNTLHRELTCLRQMLRLAKRAGKYRHDIAAVMPVDFSANYKPVTRTLRAEELPRLLAACSSDTERAWICLALALAADVGDIERARPEDYDAAREVMRVRGTKNDRRDAEIPVLKEVKPLLEYALPHMPLSWPDVSHALGHRCARAGIQHLSPKDLRRSICSWLLAAGVPQSLVSRFMRHKSDAMVRMVYGQMTPEELGKLIAASVTPALHGSLWPLGGTADAGDLKGHSEPGTSGNDRDSSGASEPEESPIDSKNVTPALHALPAWSLALAAERVLRIAHVTSIRRRSRKGVA